MQKAAGGSSRIREWGAANGRAAGRTVRPPPTKDASELARPDA